jgi:hypothetical protein
MDAFLENKKNIWVINDSTKMDKTELEEWLKSKGLKLTGSIKEFKASHPGSTSLFAGRKSLLKSKIPLITSKYGIYFILIFCCNKLFYCANI